MEIFHNPDGSWRSVDAAVQHAILVQHGYTTASVEARRMLREPHNRSVAEAWLDAHEPGWRDKERD